MIREFTYIPSWQCESRCRHCLIPQDCRKIDDFRSEIAPAIVRSLPSAIEAVVISGGEAMLHPNRLKKLLRHFSAHNLKTYLVTSGRYFSSQSRPCGREISLLARAGLSGLALSVDAFHSPKLLYRKIKNIAAACREHDLQFRIKSLYGDDYGRVCIRALRKDGLLRGVAHFSEHIEPVGSASGLGVEGYTKRSLHSCGALSSPLVLPDGRLLSCCSARIFELLRIKPYYRGSVKTEPFGDLLKELEAEPLFQAIFIFGPRRCAELLGLSGDFRGKTMCQTCIGLLGDEANRDALLNQLKENKALKAEFAVGLAFTDEQRTGSGPLPSFRRSVHKCR